jgi:hypothetical protein
MKKDRIGMFVLAGACIAGLAACHGTRELSDVQLTQLLRTERASATDPRAPLDAGAVDCLKAWSGDANLTGGLQPASSSEAAKTACKQRIDGWIADASRNPDKVRFDELSAPPSVRRAEALLIDHRAVAAMPSANDRPPAALMPAKPVAMPPPNPTGTVGAIDVADATAAVDELDSLCQQAKQAAASGDSAQPLARYANYCDKRVQQMRQRITAAANSGNERQVKAVTENAQRVLAVGRQLATGKQGNAAVKDQ